MLAFYKKPLFAAFLFILSLSLLPGAKAQSGGSSTSVTGTVVDVTGAVVPNASVEIRNPVSGFERSTATDSTGKFSIPNVPFNPYHLTVTGQGFNSYAQDIDVRSVVPVNLNISLKVKGSAETVTVEAAGDLLENDPTFHTDVDRGLFDKIPLESASSSVSSLVTLATPGSRRRFQRSLSMAWAITRRTRFPWTASPLPTNRAKYFQTRFPSIRFSQWKSSLEPRQPNSAKRQAL